MEANDTELSNTKLNEIKQVDPETYILLKNAIQSNGTTKIELNDKIKTLLTPDSQISIDDIKNKESITKENVKKNYCK